MSDVGVFLLLFVCLLIAVGVIRFFSWLTELQEKHGSVTRAAVHTVKRYVAPRPRVMSQPENTAPVDRLSSKDGQSDGRTDSAPIDRAALLTLYKVLRKYGVQREDIRAALKGVRVPLSNDVWAAAAPDPEDAPHVTPIVGRPTSARFETDADYPYQAPA